MGGGGWLESNPWYTAAGLVGARRGSESLARLGCPDPPTSSTSWLHALRGPTKLVPMIESDREGSSLLAQFFCSSGAFATIQRPS